MVYDKFIFYLDQWGVYVFESMFFKNIFINL